MRLSHLGRHPVWRSTARKAVPLAGSSRTLHTEPGLENSILLAVVPGSTQASPDPLMAWLRNESVHQGFKKQHRAQDQTPRRSLSAPHSSHSSQRFMSAESLNRAWQEEQQKISQQTAKKSKKFLKVTCPGCSREVSMYSNGKLYRHRIDFFESSEDGKLTGNQAPFCDVTQMPKELVAQYQEASQNPRRKPSEEASSDGGAAVKNNNSKVATLEAIAPPTVESTAVSVSAPVAAPAAVMAAQDAPKKRERKPKAAAAAAKIPEQPAKKMAQNGPHHKVQCPDCEREVATYKNGKIYRHKEKPGGVWCAGSGAMGQHGRHAAVEQVDEATDMVNMRDVAETHNKELMARLGPSPNLGQAPTSSQEVAMSKAGPEEFRVWVNIIDTVQTIGEHHGKVHRSSVITHRAL